MGGLETMKLYRMAHPGQANKVPFLVLTANATTDARRMSNEAGADAFLTKPIDSGRLLHHVASLTGNRLPYKKDGPENGDREAVVYDPDLLLELSAFRDDATALQEFIELFLQNGDGLCRALKEDLKNNDLQSFKDNAHTLKGSAANVGANRISEACYPASKFKPGTLQTSGGELVNRLADEFSEFRKTIKSFLVERVGESSKLTDM